MEAAGQKLVQNEEVGLVINNQMLLGHFVFKTKAAIISPWTEDLNKLGLKCTKYN